MIPAVHKGRIGSKSCAFSARISYICFKSGAVETLNLAGGWQDAAWQMRYTAKLSARATQPAYHVSLSWPDAEQPTDQQVFEAVRIAMQDFGAEDFQSVVAIHRDRPNIHAHILLNRVHPTSGKMLSTSHDYARLEHACRVAENRMGWKKDLGRFDVSVEGNTVKCIPKPKFHWEKKKLLRELGLRPDSKSMRQLESRTGMSSLRDSFSFVNFAFLQFLAVKVRNWADLHKKLAHVGLGYRVHKSGARIVEVTGQRFMSASSIGTNFSHNRMEQRLGPFESPSERYEVRMPEFVMPAKVLSSAQRGLSLLWSLRAARRQSKERIASRQKDIRFRQQEEQNTLRAMLKTPLSPLARYMMPILRGTGSFLSRYG